MKGIIVSDTSPISNLIQIRQLELLRELFCQIIIPNFVNKEICDLEKFGYDLSDYKEADWIKTCIPTDNELLNELEMELDKGEAEAIVLSKELKSDLLLIDERLGTKRANEFGLKTIGLLGCLLECKKRGILIDVIPIVERLENETGFYIGMKLRSLVRKLSGEKKI